MPHDHVEYLPNKEMVDKVYSLTDEELAANVCKTEFQRMGYTKPGWYFWDETCTYVHGPWKTKVMADQQLALYLKELHTEAS